MSEWLGIEHLTDLWAAARSSRCWPTARHTRRSDTPKSGDYGLSG